MLRKLFVCILVLVLAGISEASQPVKLGLVRFSSTHELMKKADIITDTFRRTLSASEAITLIHRTRSESNIDKISALGKSEGCEYMLIGSVKRDKDIVVSVRLLLVATGEIVFTMSGTVQADEEASLRAESAKLAENVLEQLTGEYPKVTAVKGNDITINRGSVSGVKKGDLFRVYEEFHEAVDVDGNSAGRSRVDLAIIEVKSVNNAASTANLYKDGGDVRVFPRLLNCKIEAVSKTEAQKLIRKGTFKPETIDRNTSEAENNKAALDLNPNYEFTSIDVKDVRQLADNGSPAAQYLMGTYHLNRRDFQEARKWLQKSASQGNLKAINALGYIYENGFGVPQDYVRAYNFYVKAAEQGDMTAQNNLGYMYLDGRGVKQDYHRAFLWFSKSREQGNSSGALNMAYMIQHGLVKNKNLKLAVSLYKEAAEKGNLQAKMNLAGLYAGGIKYDKDNYYLNNAREWWNKALEQAQQENNAEAVRTCRKHLDLLPK